MTLGNPGSRLFIINTGKIWIVATFCDADFVYGFTTWNCQLKTNQKLLIYI